MLSTGSGDPEPMQNTVFVGDLHIHCTEAELQSLFGPFGAISVAAINNLDGYLLRGRSLRDKASKSVGKNQGNSSTDEMDKSPVHFSFISHQNEIVVTEEMLRYMFGKHGKVLDVSIRKLILDHKHQSGYGFVYYSNTPEGTQSALNAVKAYSDYEANGIRYQCHISHRLDQQLEQLKAKGAGDNPALSSGNQSSAHLSSTVDALGSLSLNDEQQLPKQPASARRVPTVQQVNNLTQPNGLKPKVDNNGAPPAAMNGHRRGGLPQQPPRQQGLYPQQNYAYPPSSFPAFLPPQSSFVQQVEDSDFGPLGGRPGGAFLRQRPDNLLAGPYGNFERENGNGFLPNGFNDRGSNLGKPFVSNSQYIYDDSSFPSNGYSDAPPSMLSFPSGHAYSSGPSGNGQFYEGPGPYMPSDESDSRSFNRGRNQMADCSQTRNSDFDRAVNPNPMGSAYSIPQDVYRNERPGDELPLSYFSSVPTNLHHSNQPPMIYNPSTFLGPQGGMQIYSMSPIGSNATLTLQNPLLDNNMYFVQTGPSSLSSPVGTISPLSQSPAMQVRPLHPLNAFNPLLQSPAMQSPMSQQYHIFSGCDVHYSPMPSRSLEFYG
eukprot:gene18722-19026_t